MIQDPIDMIKDLLFVITILKDSYDIVGRWW